MGKSSAKKKKANAASVEGSTKLDPDDAVFLKRAHELKDEGNRRFQAKDYVGAMDIYEQALKLTPEGHTDRAVFYSNRAACLLQVKPVNFENVVLECSMALEAHPKFGKALFRRARAYEAMGKLQLALSDVQLLLQSESNNQDALELGKRLRVALGSSEEAQQDTQWRSFSSSSLNTSPPDTANSPASPGADGAAAAGANASAGPSPSPGQGQGGRGPSLPARPPASVGKKKGRSNIVSDATLRTPEGKGGGDGGGGGGTEAGAGSESPSAALLMTPTPTPTSPPTTSFPSEKIAKGAAAGGSSSSSSSSPGRIPGNVMALDERQGQGQSQGQGPGQGPRKKGREAGPGGPQNVKPAVRQLKLIFGHDIRRAEVPANSGYGQLREVVRKRFPSLKAALIKYQDLEGDLVTITSREELRMAEAEVEAAAEKAKQQKQQQQLQQQARHESTTLSTEDRHESAAAGASAFADKVLGVGVEGPRSNGSLELVRLHIVEVSPEQEPPVPEDDEELPTLEPEAEVEEEEDMSEDEEKNAAAAVEGAAPSPAADEVESAVMDGVVEPLENGGQEAEGKAHKSSKKEEANGEEMEIDDWLFDFAQLFRTHVGIDPDGHVDFHELGMELCSEALEATVTSNEAQPLFEAAAAKFQEVAALALFNWGNVYMCAARKSMPIEEAGTNPNSKKQLQVAFEWAEGQYKLAGQKYEEALRIKPDFYEGVLALGQEKFESAKLQWAAAVAGGVDLKTWDSTSTLSLYRIAEEKMKTAAEMWEQLEAVQQQGNQEEIISKARKEQQAKQETSQPIEDGSGAAEAAEQGAAMRSQINLFWGNVLFEHSQVEYRLGLMSWKKLLESALEKFFAAGAATDEIEQALKNHPGNVAVETAEMIRAHEAFDARRLSTVESNGNRQGSSGVTVTEVGPATEKKQQPQQPSGKNEDDDDDDDDEEITETIDGDLSTDGENAEGGGGAGGIGSGREQSSKGAGPSVGGKPDSYMEENNNNNKHSKIHKGSGGSSGAEKMGASELKSQSKGSEKRRSSQGRVMND